MTRADIVAEAREWVDTPFHWQASLKGKGADCKGFVAGVARELGLPEAEALHARMADYGRVVDPRLLRRGLAATFAKTAEPQPGDVLLLRVGGAPQHLAILAGDTIIHTYALGPRRVVEVPYAPDWADALDSAWTWRSLA